LTVSAHASVSTSEPGMKLCLILIGVPSRRDAFK
jgi:hypothetical protein